MKREERERQDKSKSESEEYGEVTESRDVDAEDISEERKEKRRQSEVHRGKTRTGEKEKK